MKLEDQVCSLELSKRLKELGVKQVSLFYWYEWNNSAYVKMHNWEPEISGQMPFSAFTVAELGEFLPSRNHFLPMHGLTFWIMKISSSVDQWQCDVLVDGKSSAIFQDVNEANLRAKMLIHIIEQGLMPK